MKFTPFAGVALSVGSFGKMMEERTTSIWKGTYTLSE
jgi:hypothetical protein